jgi:phage shock protein A
MKEVTMGIMSRVIRLCRADLHGVMDQIEDKDLLLKQHLREMQAAMAGCQVRVDQLEEALRNGQRDRAMHAKQLQALGEDLDLAVARGKDDIARMLIRKLFPMRKRVECMTHRLEEMTGQLDEERDRLGVQQLAYDDTRQRVAAVRERARNAAVMADMGPVGMRSPQLAPNEEEIEWELMQRKDATRSGRTT